MLQVEKISSEVANIAGSLCGKPVVLVKFSKKGEEKDRNTIIDEIKALGLRNILLSGNISEFPEIRDIAVGLSTVGKHITLLTKATEGVDPFRILPNYHSFLVASFPDDPQANIFRPSNFPLLSEKDEVQFNVKALNDYEKMLLVIKSKLITKPTIIVRVTKDASEKDFEIIKERYLTDCIRFTFRSLLSSDYIK